MSVWNFSDLTDAQIQTELTALTSAISSGNYASSYTLPDISVTRDLRTLLDYRSALAQELQERTMETNGDGPFILAEFEELA